MNMTIDYNKRFRFRRFPVYQESKSLALRVREVCRRFPPFEYSLKSQLTRAADSVVLNIAEGSERGTDRDFARFLTTSRASANEVVAVLDIARDLGYVNEIVHDDLLRKIALLANQLTAFRKQLIT